MLTCLLGRVEPHAVAVQLYALDVHIEFQVLLVCVALLLLHCLACPVPEQKQVSALSHRRPQSYKNGFHQCNIATVLQIL